MRVLTCQQPDCKGIGPLNAEEMRKHLAEVHQVDLAIRATKVMLTHVDSDLGWSTTYKYYFGKIEVIEYVREQKEKK